jgi:hypothetical protein
MAEEHFLTQKTLTLDFFDEILCQKVIEKTTEN